MCPDLEGSKLDQVSNGPVFYVSGFQMVGFWFPTVLAVALLFAEIKKYIFLPKLKNFFFAEMKKERKWFLMHNDFLETNFWKYRIDSETLTHIVCKMLSIFNLRLTIVCFLFVNRFWRQQSQEIIWRIKRILISDVISRR